MQNSMRLRTETQLKDFLLEQLEKDSFENLVFFVHRRCLWHHPDQYWYFVVFDNDCLGMFRGKDDYFYNFLSDLGLKKSDMLEIYYRVQCIDSDRLAGIIKWYS